MYLFEFSRVEKQLYLEGNHFLFTQCICSKKKECILAAKAKSSTYPRERASRLSQSFTFFLKERNGNEVLLVGTNLNFLGCVYI